MQGLKVALLCLGAIMAGCVSENEYGSCVGIAQEGRRDPKLYYDLSIWNVFWGVVGVEMIFPPILVLHHELYCPTGPMPAPASEAKKDALTRPPPPPTNLLGETR